MEQPNLFDLPPLPRKINQNPNHKDLGVCEIKGAKCKDCAYFRSSMWGNLHYCNVRVNEIKVNKTMQACGKFEDDSKSK